jgi:hypothetical protein
MGIEDLRTCYDSHTTFTQDDIRLGINLWQAFQNKNLISLKEPSETSTTCFPYLPKVYTAYIQSVQHRRPERILQQLIENGITDFDQLFTFFSRSEGIYGYGDLQVKEMYKNLYK